VPLVGYRDFNFGTEGNSTPTGEKPESKLWFNDGFWWGSLWNPKSLRYEIHQFHPGTQAWSTTGVAIDNRRSSKADCLWDGEKLYAVSHIFSTVASPTVPVNSGRLYRYSYDADTDTYSLDAAFPVEVNSSRSETLVLEKDSTGRLWVTWVEGGKVKVNCSQGDDHFWGVPFDLPSQTVDADGDDISSIIAFGGDRIGIFWTNQTESNNRFSVHLDSDPPGTWQTSEVVSPDPGNGPLSDDHINLKAHAGYVYAVTKTNLDGPSDPLVMLNRRSPDGTWSYHVVGTGVDDHTRPIVLLMPEQQTLHVLMTSTVSQRDLIYRKSASMTTLTFAPGRGDLFIDSPTDLKVGNITSTKQNLTSLTGLLAIASDQNTRYYFHNYFAAPPTADVTPVLLADDGTLLRLAPGRPNPFRNSTRIHFRLGQPAHTELSVFDVSGRRVRTLVDGPLPAGEHSEMWDGRLESGVAGHGGVYFIRVKTAGAEAWQRLVMVR
jgi:hypothetical protein